MKRKIYVNDGSLYQVNELKSLILLCPQTNDYHILEAGSIMLALAPSKNFSNAWLCHYQEKMYYAYGIDIYLLCTKL